MVGSEECLALLFDICDNGQINHVASAVALPGNRGPRPLDFLNSGAGQTTPQDEGDGIRARVNGDPEHRKSPHRRMS